MTQLSRIVAGLWRLEEWGLSDTGLADWMQACIQMGVTTFDLAEVYGGHSCEPRVGDALAARPGLRDQLQLVTKFGIRVPGPARPKVRRHHYDASAAHLRDSVERALRELRVERIDAMLIHRPDLLFDSDELATAAKSLIASGDIGALGVSNFTVSQVELLSARLGIPLAAHQVETSVLCTSAFEDSTLDQAQRLGIPVMGWSPLGGGRLFSEDEQATRVRAVLETAAEAFGTGVYTLAYAFLLQHPAGIHPITGSGRLERVQAAVAALEIELDRETWYDIWTASTGEALP